MLTNVTLRDSTVMQSFAYDDLNQVWIFARWCSSAVVSARQRHSTLTTEI